tara:strand:+ start:2632 stop:3279 length:648 start_codon:yes stop_codon:yes gene_type:complete
MKMFLASILAAAAMATPVSAEDKVKSWRSFDSVGCMMLRECTEGVKQIKSWTDLGPEYEVAAAELDEIIKAMDKVGAAIYLANEKYFALRMRGVYDVRGNNMFLNEFYIDQPTKIIQVIRHEGWHAAQDCMAGTLNNTFTALIHPEEAVPDWIRRGAERTYPKNVLPFEAEAMWAMYVENKTVEALSVCGSAKKMWEHYTPTPLTGEWLKKKGFM